MFQSQRTQHDEMAKGNLAPHPLNMQQTWYDLLFMHWPVPVAKLEALLPPSLQADRFDGDAWVGIIPFALNNIRMKLLPHLPCVPSFAEVNVRTYVKPKAGKEQGKPGIFFFCLDAENPLVRFIAKTFYKLPYVAAKTRKYAGNLPQESVFQNSRAAQWLSAAPQAVLQMKYHPNGDTPLEISPGSLEHWLTERYRYYATAPEGLYACDIHHPQWSLHPAEAEIETNTMAQANGIVLPDQKPLLHFAPRMTAEIGLVKKL